MNYILGVIVIVWAQLIRVKRWIKPRPFRLVKVRRRCRRCHRRMRESVRADIRVPGVCQRCVNNHLRK